jgi:NDP-sugar pyrophosphorylase family protein
MKAVVLAAGVGKRLRPLTLTVPKPMVPVGGHPVLEYILAGLRGAGVREFLIVTGYLAEQVETHFGDGGRWGLRCEYRRQEAPTGSADAALLAESFIGGEPFFMSWGDILTSPDNYLAVARRHAAGGADAVLGLNWMDDVSAGGAVYRDGERVTDLIEKPPPGTAATNWNNAGVMILPPAIFPLLREMEPSPRGERELPRAIPTMIRRGMSVIGVEFGGLWSDVGTPEQVEHLDGLAARGELGLPTL